MVNERDMSQVKRAIEHVRANERGLRNKYDSRKIAIEVENETIVVGNIDGLIADTPEYYVFIPNEGKI